MTDSQLVTIDYIKQVIDKKGLTIAELSRISGVGYTSLSSILRKQRVIGDSTILKISKALGVNFEDLKNPKVHLLENVADNHVKERETTYQGHSVEIPDFVGENPQSLFLEKLKYLSRIGEMRNAGLLEEEEFLKIKSRLINLL